MTDQYKTAVRFRHHFLDNGTILTVATCLNYEPVRYDETDSASDMKMVKMGWAVFNPADGRWVRKFGCNMALNRMELFPLHFTLSVDEPVLCDYISLRALQVLIGSTSKKSVTLKRSEDHPSCLSDATLYSILCEAARISMLVAERVKIL